MMKCVAYKYKQWYVTYSSIVHILSSEANFDELLLGI